MSGGVPARLAPTLAPPAAQAPPSVARRGGTDATTRPAQSSPAWSFGNLTLRLGSALGERDVPRTRGADGVARRADTAPVRIAEAAAPIEQRACATCQDAATVQRRGGWSVRPSAQASSARPAGGQVGGQASRPHAPPSVERALTGPGWSLGGEIRSSMERRFGLDFGAIRIHTDSGSAGSGQHVGACACTVCGNIVFGAGEYRPDSMGSEALLAHELVETIQQGASRPLGAAATPAAGRAPGFSVSRMPQGQSAGAPDVGHPAGRSAAPAGADHAAAPTMRGGLTVGVANDRYEQEAVGTAAQAIRLPDPAAGPPAQQRAASRDADRVGLPSTANPAAGRLHRLAYSPLFDDSPTAGGAAAASATSPAAAAPAGGAAAAPAAATQQLKRDETTVGTVQTLQRATIISDCQSTVAQGRTFNLTVGKLICAASMPPDPTVQAATAAGASLSSRSPGRPMSTPGCRRPGCRRSGRARL
jgi:hypothetical protein